ncbi:inner centromere protein-like [Musca vetustissima]|uniref:inner centromere protein-like n=1 Tax=Musca vetustissima TaxID=27455 RepID=UPI002AB773AE|nr:inner centromere protein-like [Musca vetustissima]
MEDLVQLYDITECATSELEQLTEEWLVKLRAILFGPSAIPAAAKEVLKEIPAASPQQTKKRVKRLSSLNEEECEDIDHLSDKNKNKGGKLSKGHVSPRKSKRSNAELLAVAETMEQPNLPVENEAPIPRKRTTEVEAASKANSEAAPAAERRSEASNLMPPPPAPVLAAPPVEEGRRPKREARIKCEKNLKEPTLKTKMRQPEEVKVKLEHEQRPSQMHEKSQAKPKHAVQQVDSSPEELVGSVRSTDSILILPPQKPDCIVINGNSDDEGAAASEATVDTTETVITNEVANDEPRMSSGSTDGGTRALRIKIKREKVSLPSQEDNVDAASDDTLFKAPISVPQPLPAASKCETTTLEESSMVSNSVLSSTTSSTAGKKTRKKKEAPRPIKVERFSDLDRKPSPVSSRTRQGSTGIRLSQTDNDNEQEQEQQAAETTKRGASIYEDAVEAPPINNSKLGGTVNETVNLGPSPAPADATMNLGPVPNDATFCTNPAQTTFQVTPGQTTFVVEGGNPNATVTLNKNSGADATFDVRTSTKADKNDDDGAGQRSFETAKDSSLPHDESLLTEDESVEKEPEPAPVPVAKAKPSTKASKTSASAKSAAYKMPTRTNELFNPLAQSPVKMRVEAFENAAAAASEQSKRPQRIKKENVTPNGATTPVIGKLPAPALGRFLTPTQSSNVTTTGSAVAKKVPTSASKALQKSTSGMLQRSASTASNTKTLQRENSGDDFRKGLHNLAEERKKQREQKHLLAAQQREAKERERAERMAKLAKEREEKRLQKLQEQEQKRRELEEIQRKLRLQEEEAARAKAAKEREMLLQMKQQQMNAKQRMMPPPPKASSKYTFEMLHEDDSTDDEDKVSYKRPPPPSWSRSHKREPYVLKQEYTPSGYIDSFFSVQPMTPDLKQIFPNIDARHLKRNSSVLWSTPPRYSELPKY